MANQTGARSERGSVHRRYAATLTSRINRSNAAIADLCARVFSTHGQAIPAYALDNGRDSLTFNSGGGFGSGSRGSGSSDRTGGFPPAGGGGTPPGGSRPDRPGRGGGPERPVTYQPEERYWTDYLRIALPVVGLLLMLGLFLFWAEELIGDSNGTEPTPIVGAIDNGDEPPETAGTPTATSTSEVAITATSETGAGTDEGDATEPTETDPPTDEPPATTAPTAEPETTEEPVPDEPEPEEATELAIGGSAVVTELGDQLTVREEPVDGASLANLIPGDTLTILDGPEEAGELTWWQVETANGLVGWVAESSDGNVFIAPE